MMSVAGGVSGEQDSDERLARLMAAYQAGEVEAFEELYATLAGDLLRHLRAVDRDGVAHDLLQETFLEVHRSRHTYLPPLPVRPWVFGVARNVVRRHRRATGRRLRREEAAAAESADPAASTARRAAVDARDVDEALASLGEARRRPWEMHHVHGFSFEEIARRLGIPVGAAKLRSSRAMRALRTLLGIETGGRRG